MDVTKRFVRLRQYGATFLGWGVCFLMVLALILSGLYQAFQAITLRSLARQNTDFSAQMDTLSGMVQTTVRSYGLQMFYAPAVARLRQHHFALDTLERAQNLRELNAYVSSSEFVDSVSVYNEGTGFVYTTDPNLLADSIDRFADREAAGLFLNRSAETHMRPLRRSIVNPVTRVQRDFYSFLFFEMSPRGVLRGGALMVNVPLAWYEQQLLGFDQEGSYLLLNENGALLTTHEPNLSHKAALFWHDIVADNAQNQVNNYLMRKIGGEQTVCFYARLQSSGWYCMRILPLDQSVGGLTALRNGLLACFAGALVLLALAFAAMLLLVYLPYRRMSQALRRLPDADPALAPLGPDEQLSELVESSLEHTQARLLDDMLEGRPPPGEHLPAPPLVLLLTEGVHQRELHHFLKQQAPHVILTWQNGCGVALLSQTDELAAAALCGAVASRFSCRCFYSAPRARADRLAECYSRLQELRAQAFWYPGQRILCETLLPVAFAQGEFSDKDAAPLLSALRAGELEVARSLWKSLLETLPRGSFRQQRFAFNRLSQLLRELLREELPDHTEPLPLGERLEEIADIGQLNARFDVVFALLAGSSAARRQSRLDGIAAQAAHRIEVGCEDSALSLGKIAGEMGLSSAYLGRIFRASHGMSVSEYLNRTRVQQAQTLLRQTGLAVEAVAARVGFENTKYFYVVFKNLTGRTPLQYRKGLQREDGQ